MSKALMDLTAVLGSTGLEPGVLSVVRGEPDRDQLVDWLDRPGASGWLMTPSAVLARFDAGWQLVTGTPGTTWTDGPILAGEIWLDRVSSVHLRRHGDRLVSHRFVEGAAAAGAGEAALPPCDVLVEPRSYRSTEGDRDIRVRVFWRAERRGEPVVEVWTPWCARFAGWEA